MKKTASNVEIVAQFPLRVMCLIIESYATSTAARVKLIRSDRILASLCCLTQNLFLNYVLLVLEGNERWLLKL